MRTSLDQSITIVASIISNSPFEPAEVEDLLACMAAKKKVAEEEEAAKKEVAELVTELVAKLVAAEAAQKKAEKEAASSPNEAAKWLGRCRLRSCGACCMCRRSSAHSRQSGALCVLPRAARSLLAAEPAGLSLVQRAPLIHAAPTKTKRFVRFFIYKYCSL